MTSALGPGHPSSWLLPSGWSMPLGCSRPKATQTSDMLRKNDERRYEIIHVYTFLHFHAISIQYTKLVQCKSESMTRMECRSSRSLPQLESDQLRKLSSKAFLQDVHSLTNLSIADGEVCENILTDWFEHKSTRNYGFPLNMQISCKLFSLQPNLGFPKNCEFSGFG